MNNITQGTEFNDKDALGSYLHKGMGQKLSKKDTIGFEYHSRIGFILIPSDAVSSHVQSKTRIQ